MYGILMLYLDIRAFDALSRCTILVNFFYLYMPLLMGDPNMKCGFLIDYDFIIALLFKFIRISLNVSSM